MKKLKLNTKDTLLGTKLQKIRRDFDDYNTDRIFCWKKRWSVNPNIPDPNNIPLDRDRPIGPTPLMECVPRPTIRPYAQTICPLMTNRFLLTRSKAPLALIGNKPPIPQASIKGAYWRSSNSSEPLYYIHPYSHGTN